MWKLKASLQQFIYTWTLMYKFDYILNHFTLTSANSSTQNAQVIISIQIFRNLQWIQSMG